MIDDKRLAFLCNYVARDANVKELLTYYSDRILSYAHRPNSITAYGLSPDPNGIESIRDMAVLEFINTLLNYEKGENDDSGKSAGITGFDPE